jgi:1,4-dihydroxy-2-naphthoyl-CoA hydrolase
MSENQDRDDLNDLSAGTLIEALGIRFTRSERGYLEATMPVDHRTHQPYGLLHGGASAALAETLGSYGSHVIASGNGQLAVGVELNINHLKSKRSGEVTGRARLQHEGRRLHVWNIEIVDEAGALLAVSRLTVMIREAQREG